MSFFSLILAQIDIKWTLEHFHKKTNSNYQTMSFKFVTEIAINIKISDISTYFVYLEEILKEK